MRSNSSLTLINVCLLHQTAFFPPYPSLASWRKTTEVIKHTYTDLQSGPNGIESFISWSTIHSGNGMQGIQRRTLRSGEKKVSWSGTPGGEEWHSGRASCTSHLPNRRSPDMLFPSSPPRKGRQHRWAHSSPILNRRPSDSIRQTQLHRQGGWIGSPELGDTLSFLQGLRHLFCQEKLRWVGRNRRKDPATASCLVQEASLFSWAQNSPLPRSSQGTLTGASYHTPPHQVSPKHPGLGTSLHPLSQHQQGAQGALGTDKPNPLT